MRFAREMAWISAVFSFALLTPLAAEKLSSVHLSDFEQIPTLEWSDTVYDIPTALKKPNYPFNDYDWNTGGYAKLEPVEKREAFRNKDTALGDFIKGKYSAKVRFTVPTEFKDPADPNFPDSWESGMTLSTETATRLPITDWSDYKSLSLDVFNPSKEKRTVTIRVADSGSAMYEKSAEVAQGPWTVELILKELEEKRINVKDIRSLTVWMDTAKLKKAPELYFDSLQLNSEILGKGRSATSDSPSVEYQGLDIASQKIESEEEEEFEFEEEEEEFSEEYLRKYGGRFKQPSAK